MVYTISASRRKYNKFREDQGNPTPDGQSGFSEVGASSEQELRIPGNPHAGRQQSGSILDPSLCRAKRNMNSADSAGILAENPWIGVQSDLGQVLV